jgi:hypothetical protein
MSRRKPAVSDLNIRSEQPMKRFKTSPSSLNPSSYRNIFEQFDDVAPCSPLTTIKIEHVTKGVVTKVSSQQSSAPSSSTARSIMAKTAKTQEENDQLWSTLFQPKTRDDLILHPRKVKELDDLLQNSCEIVKSNQVRTRSTSPLFY